MGGAAISQKSQVALIRTTTSVGVHSMNQETLLDRAYHFDEQALSQLHDRYFPVVYRYVRYRLDNEQLVEDISSEVFLRLLEALRRRHSEIRDVRAWLIGTAANLVNDHLRQKYRKPLESLEENENLPASDNPQQTAERAEYRRTVQTAMHRLTHEQQHVLALRFSQELSIEETAQIMSKSPGAIKVLQFRALAALRKWLEMGERRA